ncbi:hypothetical protein VSDG_08992 [Cytospora chrysosperma]|uniref:Uncharacterized protein n=1 Tax=Cytospora chrysosperma TaxID=252740 RepID=A0A423VDG3_CYTCH|nr:hypothetical protein VSDG_08992 [Valsa sordida]
MMEDCNQRQVEMQLVPTTPPRPLSERPLSPPPTLLTRRPISSRASVTSLKKMPMIREHESPLLMNVPNQRPRPPRTGAFYQYGEDYITPWHLVGACPSPAPRAARTTTKQAGSSSVRDVASEDSSSSDSEPDEKQGRRCGVRDKATRGGWRRLCESRRWAWL